MLAATAFGAPSGEIVVWGMGSEGNQLPHLARLFEQQNPGTRIITQAIPWSGAHDRLITAVAGDVPPDVTQLGTTWVPELAAMNALMPVEDKLKNSRAIRSEDFFPSTLNTGRWDDRLYAIPWYVDTRVVFYRADLLEKAGWDRYPETWEELERMAADLTRDLDGDGQTDQYGLNLPARDEQTILPFIWQAGGRILDEDYSRVVFDSPATRRALDFYASFFRKGHSLKAEAAHIDPFVAFSRGLYVSWISGPWMVGEYERRLPPEMEGRWKVAMLPGDKRRTSFLGGSNLAIFKDTRNPELAWAFVEFLSQPQTQLRWNELTGNLPAAREAWEHPRLAENPFWSVFRRQLEDARSAPSVENWEAMAEVIKNEMEDMILGGQSADKTAEDMTGRFVALLESRRVHEGNLAAQAPWLLIVLGTLALALTALTLRRRAAELKRWRQWRIPALFLFPILLHLSIFMFVPILASLFLSFTNYDLYSIGDWRRTSLIGLSNYIQLFQDPLFWKAVRNTAYFMAVAGPLTIAVALGAALLLYRLRSPLAGLFRAGYFLPVVTPLVAVAVVWRWIYSPQQGLLNWLLGLFDVPPQTWLADPVLAMPSLILLAVWKNFGYGMIIFLTGLQAIPSTVYEAAAIDGAPSFARFRHVTFPLLRPTTVFVTVITTIGYMQFFAEPYIMTEMGGPQNQTLSVVLYLYKEGFRFFHLGYASAMAYTLCLAIAVLSYAQLRWARSAEASA